MSEQVERVVALVNEQAEDPALWFDTTSASEAYLQRALRRLHEAIEGVSQEECALAALDAEQESMERLKEGHAHPGYIIGMHWLAAAYDRICAGEPEAEVMRDFGWEYTYKRPDPGPTPLHPDHERLRENTWGGERVESASPWPGSRCSECGGPVVHLSKVTNPEDDWGADPAIPNEPPGLTPKDGPQL